jgi:large subunit ribosomal protein L24
MKMSNVKKGDAVKIIAGNDKGKAGTIIAVDRKNGKVAVQGEGITMAKHFVKPRNAQEKGGIVDKERFIDESNVMVICPSCNKTTKIAIKMVDGKKVRTCKECGASLDAVKASAAKKATKAVKKTSAKKKAESADKE